MCPICGCTEVCEFFRKSERTLLICSACRHIWWDLFPSPDQLSAYYRLQYTGAHAQESIQAGAREYYRSHLHDLLALIARPASQCHILDYGCSIPVLLMEAEDLGFERTVGVDYAEECSSYTAGRHLEIIQPDALEQLPDESLDIARFSHTLEHSLDPVSILSGVLRKLRPEGLLYITQPNFPVFRFGPSPYELKDSVYPEHLHFFSPLSLIEMGCRLSLRIHRFFTHQNEAATFAQFEGILDLEYARFRLSEQQSKGDSFFPALSNYPYYVGENSVFYAFKTP